MSRLSNWGEHCYSIQREEIIINKTVKEFSNNVLEWVTIKMNYNT